MEVVGAAASVTGILGFAGQAIDGIIQLRAFFRDITLAPRRTEDLLKDMESLTDTLADIQRLVATLERIPEDMLKSGAALNTAILKSHLKGCADDIATWVKVTENADPRSEKGLKAFFRKVKIATNKSGFEEFGKKLSSHQQRIGISLSVLGRSLDQAGIERLDELCTKFDGLTEAHLKLNDRINTKIALSDQIAPISETVSEFISKELQPLERWIRESAEDQLDMMSINHSDSQKSMESISHSLSSLASHMSQLLERTHRENSHLGNSPIVADVGIRQTEWCCDAISGIDDAFEEDGSVQACLYCSSLFSDQGDLDRSYDRGRHLSEKHAFGSCNHMIAYNSWEELELHLIEFHSMEQKSDRNIGHFNRRRRPLHLFRGDAQSHGQPLAKAERSTEGLIIEARLTSILLGSGITSVDTGRILEALDKSVFEKADSSEILLKTRYEISCAEEELIVSGNENFVFERSFPERLAIEEASRKMGQSLGMRGSSAQRSRINDWLFRIFTESNTLKALLRSGRVTSEMEPAISPDWVVPIMGFWDIDEAATGLELLYETSDGAVDSRDDLKIDVYPSNAPYTARGPFSETGERLLGLPNVPSLHKVAPTSISPFFTNSWQTGPVREPNTLYEVSDRMNYPQPVFHNFLRAFHPFHPTYAISNTTEILPLNEGDVILVHAISAYGWADGTLLISGARGWLPSNYCKAYEPELIRNLLKALLNFRDFLRGILPSQNKVSDNDKFMRDIISGVRYLLEKSNCLTRESPMVQNNEGLRQKRKALLSDLSALVKIVKRFQDQTASPEPTQAEADYAENIIDEIILSAFKTVIRGVGFLDIFEENMRLL